MKILSASILLLILFTACSEEKREVKDPLNIKNKSSADLPKGGIPYEISFYTDLQKNGQSIDEKISVLRDYSIMYGDELYYNNLLESSIIYLNLEESHADLSDHDLRFLLKQFAIVDSNIANLRYIPILLNEAYSHDLMTNDEVMKYSAKIFDKNTEEINSIAWSDKELHERKLAELKSAKFNSEYFRGRVYSNHINSAN